MLNNKEVAEEITQDVLIKCIEKINYFEGKSKLKTWVYKIAYNEALNYLRQNKPIVTDLTDELFKTGKSSLSNNLFQQDLKCFINQHFDKLPADQKEILTLFYLET